jgi:hypothetical protein
MVGGLHSKGTKGQTERSAGRHCPLLFWLGACVILGGQETRNAIMIRMAQLSAAGIKACRQRKRN